MGGRGYFGWMGGFGALGGWVGVVIDGRTRIDARPHGDAVV